jgi:hypothetical protein
MPGKANIIGGKPVLRGEVMLKKHNSRPDDLTGVCCEPLQVWPVMAGPRGKPVTRWCRRYVDFLIFDSLEAFESYNTANA